MTELFERYMLSMIPISVKSNNEGLDVFALSDDATGSIACPTLRDWTGEIINKIRIKKKRVRMIINH